MYVCSRKRISVVHGRYIYNNGEVRSQMSLLPDLGMGPGIDRVYLTLILCIHLQRVDNYIQQHFNGYNLLIIVPIFHSLHDYLDFE